MKFRKRIIPLLLIHKGGLFKTIKFRRKTYIGDPVNCISIFNEKEVDELIVLDIDASVNGCEPNYNMIENIASECFMPLCYGGGVKNINQMKLIYSLGIEKISISSAAVNNPNLISDAADIFGSQSVLVTVDVKKNFFGGKSVYIYNGKSNTRINPLDFVKKMEHYGAGEIMLNSVDKDGMMMGFDLELLKKVKDVTRVPIIAAGGAGEIIHLKRVFEFSNVDAVACGSMFVYQGPMRGVLISYLNVDQLNHISA